MKIKYRRIIAISAFAQLFMTSQIVGQLIAYESFSMPVGSGIIGSGDSATGWVDTGWLNGSNAYFQTIAPIPILKHQFAGGGIMDGSDRAVLLTTKPEPTPQNLYTTRQIYSQNTTIYFSFLIRPVTVGTGSDTLGFLLSNGSNPLTLVSLQPDVSQQTFNLKLLLGGGGNGGSISSFGSQSLMPLINYLIVGRVTWPNSDSVKVETWINPPINYPGNGSQTLNKTITGSNTLNIVGLGVSSNDTGGPSSSAIFDELRIGYTWGDVVIPIEPVTPTLVPEINISHAVRLRWQSQTGKTYQPQYSYNLSTWINFGSTISGNGQTQDLFDSTESGAKKFYRLLAQ